MSRRSRLAVLFTPLVLALSGCGDEAAGPTGTGDEPAEAEQACGLCSGKADGTELIAAGCETEAVLRVANESSFVELDIDARLNRLAARRIVDRRDESGSFSTVDELDAVPYVGPAALSAILAYAASLGHVAACEANAGSELGLISDLDKTVIPPSESDDVEAAPYPGVAELYRILELRNEGKAGDVFYVTARTPDRVEGVPSYLEDHDIPAGPIETGISGMPWVAQKEKIADCSKILDSRGSQKFVLFGDTSHRDPEVYQAMLESHPDRISAALVHKVTATVSEHRLVGLHLYENYAQAAAILFGLGILDETEARRVMTSARDEGLVIDDADMDALIDVHAP